MKAPQDEEDATTETPPASGAVTPSSSEDADVDESVASEEESNDKNTAETPEQKNKETWVAVKGHPPDQSV